MHVGAGYEIGQWTVFFSAQTAAAAALAGLIFVAISINLKQIVSGPHLVARSAKALFTMTGILLMSTLSIVPGQPVRMLGAELAALGAAMWMAMS
jgi:modulator of FtsH protease